MQVLSPLSFCTRDSWSLGRNTTLDINREVLNDWLNTKGKNVNFFHLSSSACLSGMAHELIPSDSRGVLLPGGEMALYGLVPSSGEGVASECQLKYHSISVCAVKPDINDAMDTLERYANIGGFIADKDYPVIFAINTPAEITSDPLDITKPIIDPGREKMDLCEFAIRDYVPHHEIEAIIVPDNKFWDASSRLKDCPALLEKINPFGHG
ncbi:hypothetical protein ACQYE5_003028 [Enterobacter cancerogenus]